MLVYKELHRERFKICQKSRKSYLFDLLHYLCILKGEEIIGYKRLGSDESLLILCCFVSVLWYWALVHSKEKIVSAFFFLAPNTLIFIKIVSISWEVNTLIFIKIVSISCEVRLIAPVPWSRGEKVRAGRNGRWNVKYLSYSSGQGRGPATECRKY